MTYLNLKEGDNVMYEDADETVQVAVLKIDIGKKIVRFVDGDNFEWDEKFEDIPQTVIKIIN